MSTSNIFPSTSQLEFITSRRGGVTLLYDGYRYHRKKIYTNGDSFFKCCVSSGCKGNLTVNTRNEITKISKAHNIDCKPDVEKNVILKKLDCLKQKSSCNFVSIKKQYEETVRELKDVGYELLTKIPRYENIKTGLYNERNKVLGVAKTRFNNAHDVIIPNKYKDFLFSEYCDDDKRIIVFASKEIKNDRTGIAINKYHHFFADGTFKSCPKGFAQLYTIHAYNKNKRTILPLIFALLPDKKTDTYKILFNMIKSLISWNPQKITLDFEVAAINAIQSVFPKIIFKGCYYHYNRCLWKKAKLLKVKLRTERRHVARCVGLARLPTQYIEQGYLYTMQKMPSNSSQALKKFNKYFQKQWLKKNQMMESCSCAKETIRTNNNIEGWHAKINRYIGRKYPSLAQLLEVLLTETELYHLKLSSKKKLEYKLIDDEIDAATQQLQRKEITVGHCLEIISPFSITF